MADYNENDYYKILVDSIQTNSAVPFDAYILLKKIGRIVHFAHKDSILTESAIEKLKSGQVNELYIKQEDVKTYQTYLKNFLATPDGQRYLNQARSNPGQMPEELAKELASGDDEITRIKNSPSFHDMQTRYEGESVPTIIREIFDYSADFKFFVKLHGLFDKVSESNINLCFIKIGELYKNLLIENQMLEGDHRNERLMKLCQKQMDYITRLQTQVQLLEQSGKIERIISEHPAEPTDEVSQQKIKNLEIQNEKLLKIINENKAIVEEAETKVEALNSFIKENDEYIVTLEAEAETNSSTIQELRNQVENANEQSQKALAISDTYLKDLSRNKDELLRLKDNINDLNSKMALKDQELKTLNQRLENKETKFAGLTQKQHQLVKLEHELQQKNDTIKALYKELDKFKAHQDNVNVVKKQLAEKIETFKEIKLTYIKAQDNQKGKINALKNLNEKSRKTIELLTKMNQELKKKAA